MINFNAPIHNTTGYGISATEIWKRLRTKTDVALYPIGQAAGIEDPGYHESFNNDIENMMRDDNRNNNTFKIWHQWDLHTRIGTGKYGALTFFELDTLLPNEVSSMNHPDTILVSSKWAKEIVENHGVKNVGVAPLGVDLDIFNPKNFDIDKNEKYVFINVGKWEIRKGHDLLVNMFNEAFTEEDNVELWMINHNAFLNQEQTLKWHKLYGESKLGSKIKILPRLDTHVKLADVMNRADCGIYPSRGEGWNNEAIETMALNKPIILTNYSAHTEYANNDNAYLIDVDKTEPAEDGIWFTGQGNWAKLGVSQIEQTIEHMRYVYKNDIRTNPNGLKTAQKYTWQNTADEIWKYLN